MKTDGLRVEVRYNSGVAIARPVGVLDIATYATLRDTLLKYAAEQPDGLVVELDQLDMPSIHAISVFSLVAMRVADWPGVPVVLVAERNSRRSMLTAGAISRFVQVHASIADAVSAMDEPPIRSRAVIELPPSPVSTRRARRFVRANCERWRVTDLSTDATTVVTALVGNTLTHTDSTAFVRMELRRGLLTIAVSDNDPRPAVLRERPEGGVPQSGLATVATITRVWGCTPAMTGGKTVWAVLKLPEHATSVSWRGRNGE